MTIPVNYFCEFSIKNRPSIRLSVATPRCGVGSGRAGGSSGGGGDSNMKIHGCVCQESENVPILNYPCSW